MSTTPESADMPLFLPAVAQTEAPPSPPQDSQDAEPPETPADSGIAPLFQPPTIAPAPAKGADDQDDDEGDEQSPDAEQSPTPRRRRRGSRGGRGKNHDDDAKDDKPDEPEADGEDGDDDDEQDAGNEDGSSRRLRRRRRRDAGERARAEVTALKGSTRLEAKRQRRREGRAAGRRRQSITEAEFLARREAVDRQMVVREKDGLNQIAVLEDGILVEHYVARRTQTSMVGNVYLGKVQNVLPSMEAAFVDLGKGRNAVLYAGEVNWDAVGLDGQPKRIEQALSSGDPLMVQVTKDPIGHKGARLTSQVTLAGRYLVLVPSGAMTGISRKLPESERVRLKRLLRDIVPDSAGVIVRTAAEGASEEQLRADVQRLQAQWEAIEKKAKNRKNVPVLLKGEPELAVRVVRDVFNEDFTSLTIAGADAWKTLRKYVKDMAPDLLERLHQWKGEDDIFTHYRIDEQLAKGMDRKVWLPSGGSLVIDRTEAMTVIDVNTGRFTGKGGTLEETVTKNNIEAAEEIVRQLRLRDIGGIIVIDFIDMVLESNRDLVLRRLIECLGRDRTRHQVAEVTSLGLVQMTRKRVGEGLVEAFSEPCESCGGRGFHVLAEPVEKGGGDHDQKNRNTRKKQKKHTTPAPQNDTDGESDEKSEEERAQVRATLATIAAAAAESKKSDDGSQPSEEGEPRAQSTGEDTQPAGESHDGKDHAHRERAEGKKGRGKQRHNKRAERGGDQREDSATDEPADQSAGPERKHLARDAVSELQQLRAKAQDVNAKRDRTERSDTSQPASATTSQVEQGTEQQPKKPRRRRVVSTSQAPEAVSETPQVTQTITAGGAAVVSTGSSQARPSRRATAKQGSADADSNVRNATQASES